MTLSVDSLILVGVTTDGTRVEGEVWHNSTEDRIKFAAGSGAVQDLLVKNNFAATTLPAVGDDSNDGYTVGSEWIDTTNNISWICLDATVGAAVWKPNGMYTWANANATEYVNSPATFFAGKKFKVDVPYAAADYACSLSGSVRGGDSTDLDLGIVDSNGNLRTTSNYASWRPGNQNYKGALETFDYGRPDHSTTGDTEIWFAIRDVSTGNDAWLSDGSLTVTLIGM